ncbi:MAG: IS4 family transposase [Cyanobacteria bacterium P01_D01_bin.105]
MQRFLSLGVWTRPLLWQRFITIFLHTKLSESQTVYVAIDRTGWRSVNLLMVSLIWQKRAIPIAWIRLDKLGCSHYCEQTQVLTTALSYLSAYSVVVLGDREFCSVELASWLGEQGSYFCLRLKASTQIKTGETEWQALSKLGLQPGSHVFFNELKVTKTKGFGAAKLAGKWKRRYRGFAPDEPWFILTNLDSLDTAILAYQKRFSIEQLFRDLKLGGYCLEACRLEGKRFMAMVLLISMAYTCATTQGQQLKRRALQQYIARPERAARSQKRHSAFHVGLAAHRWVPVWHECQQLVSTLMRLNPGKIHNYLKGLKAMNAVLAAL